MKLFIYETRHCATDGISDWFLINNKEIKIKINYRYYQLRILLAIEKYLKINKADNIDRELVSNYLEYRKYFFPFELKELDCKFTEMFSEYNVGNLLNKYGSLM